MSPASPTPLPAEAALEFWTRCANLADLWWTRHGAVDAFGAAAHRLTALIAFVRSASPLYHALYQELPEDPELAQLPKVTRAQLMRGFDDWATDRRVTRAAVDEFLSDRNRIGETFLDRYRVWKSSGTSGQPGIFVQDQHALAVYDALVAAHLEPLAFGAQAARLVAGAGRVALIAAMGDHYASITSLQHLRRIYPAMSARSFSALQALKPLVAGLNDCMPAIVASYPSVLELLAAEKRSGRLRIEPALIWSGGEHLAEAARHDIEYAFGCAVMNEYGASECLSIGYACREGWVHLNSEWVILEGVNADGSPTPPGDLSHTVLLTNLANWAQPIIRYDLGDRILLSADRCRCGSPLPAFRVEGRKDATLTLHDKLGAAVCVVPLALSTVIEEAVGERRFQIAQTGPDRLVLRFDHEGDRSAVFLHAVTALRAYLATLGLRNVFIALDAAAPRLDPRSAKLQAVVVEEAHPHAECESTGGLSAGAEAKGVRASWGT